MNIANEKFVRGCAYAIIKVCIYWTEKGDKTEVAVEKSIRQVERMMRRKGIPIKMIIPYLRNISSVSNEITQVLMRREGML
jgi:hypothetical protein